MNADSGSHRRCSPGRNLPLALAKLELSGMMRCRGPMRIRDVVTLLFVCVPATIALTQGKAQDTAGTRFDALASLIEAKMREYGVPGVAAGIVERETVTIRGFGVTSVENPAPITEHTVFPIASISKTFAATAAMRLVEQGTLDLRAPVRKYLPEFRVQDEAASRDVTLWHLLTHTG